MQLTKLEINGFKSFAKKTELLFGQGITGILGPNGCGKSNISDAFRFVLGEQSARALRGKKVEDFIFGGTEKRKPMSYCEVSMYFDNSDGALPSPYSEVAVTRRAFRSGESEYYINKAPCRLRDIQELFRDTGIGKDGYSIIGQGRVSEILSDRSGDRRIVFEEAAGVMKYRSRKEEAERKLQHTEKNIVRLNDILKELEERLEPLREQSEKADVYFKLREELRDIEINLFLYQYDRSHERIAQLKSNKQQLEDELQTASADEEGCIASCSDTESMERALSQSISEASQRLVTLSTRLESELGSGKLIEERIASLERTIEQSATESAVIDARLADNSSRIESIRLSFSDQEDSSAQLNTDFAAVSDKITGLQAEIDAKDAKLDAMKQSMMDAMNRLADTKSRVSRLEAMRESLEKRLVDIADERGEADTEGEKLSAELAEIDESIASASGEREALAKKQAELNEAVSQLEARISAASKQLRFSEDEINSMDSRRRVLEEMKRAHEGYYTSVRNLLNDAAKDPKLKARMNGVVAELIAVPKEFELAVEMSLGSALQNIIVPTDADAKAIIGYLREKDYGRATLLPVSSMRPRTLSKDERAFLNDEGCFGVASELVSYDPAYRNAIENLLGRTVIVRDLDAGIRISRRAQAAFRIATLDGDILNQGGSMTGGSSRKRESSLLGREREIEELIAGRQKAEERVYELGRSINELNGTLDDKRSDVGALGEQMRKLDLLLASHNERADIVGKYISKNAEDVLKLDAEMERIRESLSDIDSESAKAADAETRLSTDNAVSNEDIREAQQELAGLRAELQRTNDEAARLQVLLMASAKERSAADAEIARLAKENEAFYKELEQRKLGAEANKGSIEGLKRELAELESSIADERAGVDALSAELRQMEEARAGCLAELDEKRARREQLSFQVAELRERLHRNELSMNKLEIDLENMVERIWHEYELTYDNAQRYRRQIAVTQSHQRCDELRRAIKELGEVNTSAIEDYRSVKERYEELGTQCTDLKNAKADLDELIEKLTESMERDFKAQFALIQQNFSGTFVELFGGGHAELVLVDKNDVLNSNIDIIAQPPGKKLQLLSLLSGGEQALTAIALLFAILKLKPAAFCILDEIDTSLDEANVDCFANYLSDYAKGTQFIIITHRKGAMAVCNSLYGVSMEEKGVSTLVSAKFE